MKINIQEILKSLTILVLPVWIILTMFFTFFTFANESMIMLFLLALVIARPLLWVSPFYLTIISWIVGYTKTKKISVCLIINIILLIVNFIFFFC